MIPSIFFTVMVLVTGISAQNPFTTTNGAGEVIVGALTTDPWGNSWTRVISTLDALPTDNADSAVSALITSTHSSSARSSPSRISTASLPSSTLSSSHRPSSSATSRSSPASSVPSALSSPTTTQPSAQSTPTVSGITVIPSHGSIMDYGDYQRSIQGVALSSVSVAAAKAAVQTSAASLIALPSLGLLVLSSALLSGLTLAL